MKTVIHPFLIALLMLGAIGIKAQSPQLNSLPSATATIFLDFDGHTVEGTYWNSNGPLFCGGAGLTNEQITEIFHRIAEDYRPFNLNVTTDSVKFLAAPVRRRMRIIFTVSSAWYGPVGGVAAVGSFTWSDDTPAFVFTALLNLNTRYIAEAGSHEAGHTLGLYHQSAYNVNCLKISEYNYGQGSGEIGWAPIMGGSYYQNFTLWHNGPNASGCTNYQDELNLITRSNGFNLRQDDHGGTFSKASAVDFADSVFNITGIIERSNDEDMFRFILPAGGGFLLDAIPFNSGPGNAGSNLDIQVSLFKNQTFINQYNPGTLLNSVIDTFLDAGTYYLKVEGRGNTYAPDYASLGSYSLRGSPSGSRVSQSLRIQLNGFANEQTHQLSWHINEQNAQANYDLEYSRDGIHFTPLARNTSGEQMYSYRPWIDADLAYRVHVFTKGSHHYSNIVVLKQPVNTGKPYLVSNRIENSLKVNSPGSYDFMIADMNGMVISKGTIGTGIQTINLPFMAKGIYIIRFSKDGVLYSEKIIK